MRFNSLDSHSLRFTSVQRNLYRYECTRGNTPRLLSTRSRAYAAWLHLFSYRYIVANIRMIHSYIHKFMYMVILLMSMRRGCVKYLSGLVCSLCPKGSFILLAVHVQSHSEGSETQEGGLIGKWRDLLWWRKFLKLCQTPNENIRIVCKIKKQQKKTVTRYRVDAIFCETRMIAISLYLLLN